MLYDKDIREPLFDFLEERYGKVRVIEEKQMGRSRADVVMVLPDLVAGIEIKSDADTYARLARQVADYDQFFDRNYAVVGTKHAMHIEEHLPPWWGIITVEPEDGVPDFYVLREARDNPRIEIEKKLRLLWRPELARLQEQNGLPKYAGKSRQYVICVLAQRVSPELLNRQISDELFERDYAEAAREIEAYREAHSRTPAKKKRRRRMKIR